MKVVVTRKWYYHSPPYKVMQIEDALTPDESRHDDTLSRMEADIRGLQEIMGRLLGHLVEETGMSLEDAQRIAGLCGDRTIEPHVPGTYGED